MSPLTQQRGQATLPNLKIDNGTDFIGPDIRPL
jgi:hypothetical protein